MKVFVYAIRDVINGFIQPIVDLNDNSAKRNFAFGINNNDQMNFAPKDYDLYKLGTFDQDSGAIETQLPELIVRGVDVIGDCTLY